MTVMTALICLLFSAIILIPLAGATDDTAAAPKSAEILSEVNQNMPTSASASTVNQKSTTVYTTPNQRKPCVRPRCIRYKNERPLFQTEIEKTRLNDALKAEIIRAKSSTISVPVTSSQANVPTEAVPLAGATDDTAAAPKSAEILSEVNQNMPTSASASTANQKSTTVYTTPKQRKPCVRPRCIRYKNKRPLFQTEIEKTRLNDALKAEIIRAKSSTISVPVTSSQANVPTEAGVGSRKKKKVPTATLR